MCHWHVTAKHGYWADEPTRVGTYLVVRRHSQRGRALYFRVHDDLARERDTKRQIIRHFKQGNWKVEACATITRCYAPKSCGPNTPGSYDYTNPRFR